MRGRFIWFLVTTIGLTIIPFLLTACGGEEPTPILESISATPASASIKVGETQQYTVRGTYSDNSTKSITASWASSNTDVATISGAGLASAKGAGAIIITATADGVSSTAALIVTAPAEKKTAILESISATPASASIKVGETQQYTVMGTYSDNSTKSITASWASSNTDVATISGAGLASAKGAGTTTITATANGVSGSATLTVTAPEEVKTATPPKRPAGHTQTTTIGCTTCHTVGAAGVGVAGGTGLPADHQERTSDICLACHG